MESVKDLVRDQEKIKEWEELLEFLIDNDYFWGCDISFEEVIYCFIKNDEIRFISVDDLSKEGREYYAEVMDIDLIDENGGYGLYDLNDDNYITTLENNTIAIWSF